MDGVIIMVIATLALSGSMFCILQGNIRHRHQNTNNRISNQLQKKYIKNRKYTNIQSV